jgi:competence protein ComEC
MEPPVSKSRAWVQTTWGLAQARWWQWREAEQQSLPLWLPVALGLGIALWFGLPWAPQRLALAAGLAGLGLGGLLLGWRWRAAWLLLVLAGLGAAELRLAMTGHQLLAERGTYIVLGRVAAQVTRPGSQQRLLIAPDAGMTGAVTTRLGLVQVTARGSTPVPVGAVVAVKALLAPPGLAAIPGGDDTARRDWFAGVGARGVALGPVAVLAAPPAGPQLWLASARSSLAHRIRQRLPGENGALAAAFITGDQGAIPDVTADAMRDAGLAHLLSISGLHIAVVVGGVVWLVRRGLALSRRLTLRWPIHIIAYAAGAMAGLGYTLLAGAQYPTVRSLLAAMLVLLGAVLGREALSLRLLAFAAFAILLLRPEALLSPSFQLSFAAVAAIIALYESRLGRWLTAPSEDDGPALRLLRPLVSLLASGLVAECALAGIGAFHFGRAGVYGVLANLVAIPFTSFIIMPLLLLALAGEALGTTAGWPLVDLVFTRLVGLADGVAALPGAVVNLPAVPVPAFAALLAGGMWLVLWRTRSRWWGLLVLPLAGGLMLAARPPDVLVAGNGRQVAVVVGDGQLAFARERVSDFQAEIWGEALGAPDATPLWLGDQPGARCNVDACVASIRRAGRSWQLLALVGRDAIARAALQPACANADILVASRTLPGWCRPRWLKLDAAALARSGSVAITLAPPGIHTAADQLGDRPWQAVPSSTGEDNTP